MTLVLLQDVLKPEELTQLRTLCAQPGAFVDGKRTAGYAAREVKTNLQLPAGPRLEAARKIAAAALRRHEGFQSAALPRRLVRLMVNRYGEGMEYGPHVDDAVMGEVRTDLSFTLFLSDPETYDGGELTLIEKSRETPVKLPAGHAVLYSTGAVHRVAAVTRGERLAVVGWVRSLIRRADQREIVADLGEAMRALHRQDGKSALYDVLSKSRSNLLRMWAED